MRFHLEMEAQANRARGRSEADARRAALRDFGGVTQARESIRDVRVLSVERLWQEIRYGTRALARSPGYALTTIAILALTIGGATAVFAAVDAVLLRSLPYQTLINEVLARHAGKGVV